MEVVKWGLIGAGDIARKRVAPALRDLQNCEFVSVSRSRADRAEAFAIEFGAPKWFADWREQLADPDIDAVHIATPVHLHAEQTIAAAEAGKHVLCEKPMAITVADCDRMIDACERSGVKLGIAYYRRFYPAIIRAKQIIESGEIGRVSVAQINAFEFFDPPADDPRRWLLDRSRSGGGPMMDFGCHRIEVLINLFGSIRQTASLYSNNVFVRSVEDTAVVTMRFDAGPTATVTVTHAAGEAQDTLEIFGTAGSIHIRELNRSDIRIVAGGGERSETHPPHHNFHLPLIDDLADAILRNREPQVRGETGREVSRIVEEIYSRGD